MEVLRIVCTAGIMALSIGLAYFYRWREKKTLRKIERMLDEAIIGSFQEKDFDESLLSAVEAKFANYLSASLVSSRNLNNEKDKIKTLIADISHQTKTPLSNILLYTQLLEEQKLSQESRVYVDELEAQTQKLQFLIAALIKTSRLENGILALKPKINPVFPMLEKAVGELIKKAEDKNITLQLEPSEEMAVFDRKWTEEAVCNLIDNAVKYTPNGGKVILRVIPYELFCCIDVIDNGFGISEDIQAKIFGRFYRAEAVAEKEGVGIGLYLVRQIATGQGGYVKVSSVTGKGSIFSLFLPRS